MTSFVNCDKNRLELEAVDTEIEALHEPKLEFLEELADKRCRLLKEEGLDTPDNLVDVTLKLFQASKTESEAEVMKYFEELQTLNSYFDLFNNLLHADTLEPEAEK